MNFDIDEFLKKQTDLKHSQIIDGLFNEHNNFLLERNVDKSNVKLKPYTANFNLKEMSGNQGYAINSITNYSNKIFIGELNCHFRYGIDPVKLEILTIGVQQKDRYEFTKKSITNNDGEQEINAKYYGLFNLIKLVGTTTTPPENIRNTQNHNHSHHFYFNGYILESPQELLDTPFNNKPNGGKLKYEITEIL